MDGPSGVSNRRTRSSMVCTVSLTLPSAADMSATLAADCAAPGLEVNNRVVADAKSRFGIDVLQYPSATCMNALREGLWCDSPTSRDDWAEVMTMDVYRLARADAGIHLL